MGLESLWESGRADEVVTGSPGGHHDVVVVGAGLTGLSTAVLLASAGRSVAVVEARHVGAGTTGRSTAKVSLLQGTRLSSIARLHSTTTVRQYVAGHREGAAWLHDFCAEQGIATQTRTACTYATTPAGSRLVEREHALAAAVGLGVRLVERTALPFATTSAVELDDQYQLDPVQVVAALATEARRHGATLVEGARVTRVRGAGPVVVETTGGTLTGDHVVVATNLPVLDRGGHFARMRPARSYSMAFTSEEPPELPGMYLSADAPSRTVRDAVVGGRRHLMVGGEGHTTGRGRAPSARLDALRSWTATHFPGLTETHAWSAQDYVPAHGLPVVGPVLPGADHLLVAGGYAKWGMTGGVAAALALSNHLLGRRTADWAEAMWAWSRRELMGAPAVVRDNAEVGLEMARGWLRPLAHTGRRPQEGEGVVRWGRTGPTAVSQVDGVTRAVSGRCPHLGGVVRWNDAEASWDCPLHGSRFTPDGGVLEGPATCPLTPHPTTSDGGGP